MLIVYLCLSLAATSSPNLDCAMAEQMITTMKRVGSVKHGSSIEWLLLSQCRAYSETGSYLFNAFVYITTSS